MTTSGNNLAFLVIIGMPAAGWLFAWLTTRRRAPLDAARVSAAMLGVVSFTIGLAFERGLGDGESPGVPGLVLYGFFLIPAIPWLALRVRSPGPGRLEIARHFCTIVSGIAILGALFVAFVGSIAESGQMHSGGGSPLELLIPIGPYVALCWRVRAQARLAGETIAPEPK